MHTDLYTIAPFTLMKLYFASPPLSHFLDEGLTCMIEKCFNSLLRSEVTALQSYTICIKPLFANQLIYIYANVIYIFLESSSNSVSTGAIVTITTFIIIALIATP